MELAILVGSVLVIAGKFAVVVFEIVYGAKGVA